MPKLVTRNTLVGRSRVFPGLAAVLVCLALPTTLPARACDAGAPGWRDPAGRCVTWRQLESVCGLPPSTACTADDPDPQADRLLPTPKGDPSLPPCHGCGCKGGPGYRAPNGRCVGWKDLARTCGPTLPGACTAEQVDPRAVPIADQEAGIAARPRRR